MSLAVRLCGRRRHLLRFGLCVLDVGHVGAAAALLALREVADGVLPAKVSDNLGAHSQWQTRVLAVAKSGS